MADLPTLYERFAASVAAFPDRTALEVAGEHFSYAELHDLAERTAALLLTGSGDRPARVGLLANRSVAAYAGYLAAQRLGATTVPLGPDQPPARTAAVVAAAGVDVVLAERDTALPCRVVVFDPAAPAAANLPEHRGGPDDVAYILHTSGSTGTPKGVPILHRNVSALLDHAIARYEIGHDSRLSQTFDLTFDPSVWDLFTAWSTGAALVVPDRNELVRPARFIAGRGITHWFCVPSIITYAQRLGDLAANSMPTLRWSLFCGEPLTVRQAAAWREAAPDSVLGNLYGPTELTVICVEYTLPARPQEWPAPANGTVPIGTVHPHLDALVLDEDGLPAEEGELCVRGPQRFPGYVRPEENAGRFVHFDGHRARVYRETAAPPDEVYYRTGDRVLAEGTTLLHLGRLDHQVKISGHRVEVGEVEAALRDVPGVAEAVVIPLTDAGGQTTLQAVYSGVPCDPVRLRTALGRRLPGYMLPRGFTRLETLPLNANRKVDRRAVAALLADSPAG